MTMLTIRLECERRPDGLTDLLQDYDNDRQYYLNGSRLFLEDSLRVRNHSPSGFFHGYGGSGPAQLALAICLQIYPQPVAEAVYQRFKGTYVATIPMEDEQFESNP